MKKKIAFLLCAVMFVLSLFSLVACTNDNDGGNNTGSGENPPITDNGGDNVNENYQGSTIPVDGEKYNASTVYCEITITAGNQVLNAILFDNKTARAVADMLPLTVSTWHPAPNFARAFDLPRSFSYFEDEPPQMSYELGSLAYWQPGPSIAMIYEASRTQTVVPVVPIGKITSNLSVLANYSGTITVAKK